MCPSSFGRHQVCNLFDYLPAAVTFPRPRAMCLLLCSFQKDHELLCNCLLRTADLIGPLKSIKSSEERAQAKAMVDSLAAQIMREMHRWVGGRVAAGGTFAEQGLPISGCIGEASHSDSGRQGVRGWRMVLFT